MLPPRISEGTGMRAPRERRFLTWPVSPGDGRYTPAIALGVLVTSWRKFPSIVPVTAYERFGLPSYWVIDPDLDRPALRAFELTEGAYTEVAHVTGDQAFHAQRPFDVQVIPAASLRSCAGRGRGTSQAELPTASTGAAGSVRVTRSPLGSLSAASAVPWCASATVVTMARPRPAPER
jgi:hypothetical protein